MTSFFSRALLSATGAAALLTSLSAQAQSENDSGNAGLETIYITAQRRVETLQDVPVAVSAFTGDQLNDAGVFSFSDIETLVPSLEIEQAFGGGQPQIRLRGVGFDDYAANNTPTVGIYVDEVAYPVPAMTQGVLFDLERAEVLRGPQGTLYGRNTTGGAVNFITAKPTDEFAAGLNTEFGNRERWQAQGFLSGPLSDQIGMRVSGIVEQGGAWQRNRVTGEELGDKDRYAVRAMIDFENDRFYALLTGHYYRDQSDGVGLYLLEDYNSNAGGTVTADTDTRATGWGVSPLFAEQAGLNVNDKPFRDNEGFGANLRLEYDFGGFSAISLTSYEDLDRREFNDWDGTAISAAEVAFNSQPQVFAQELRLVSNDNNDSPLRWTAGVYYADEDVSDVYQSDFVDSFGLSVSTIYAQEVRTLALFGQADYEINDRLTLTLGLRYEDEDRTLLDLTTDAVLAANSTIILPFADSPVRDANMSEVSGKAGLSYKVSDEMLAYASVSRGVKSGGFTALNTLDEEQTQPFRNETLWAYEAGLKSDLLDETLRVNLAAFYYDYTDQQIQGVFFSGVVGALIGRIENVPKSEIYGFELETVWAPAEGITLSNAIGWKTGEFKEYSSIDTTDPTQLIDRAGEELPFPNWSYTGSLTVTNTFAGDWSYNFVSNWTYRDQKGFLLGPEVFDVASYWLINAQLNLGPQDGVWDVGLYARNLTNTDFDETRNFFIQEASGDFVANGVRGMPRTYGLSFNIRY